MGAVSYILQKYQSVDDSITRLFVTAPTTFGLLLRRNSSLEVPLITNAKEFGK